jgi:hypothetical protein
MIPKYGMCGATFFSITAFLIGITLFVTLSKKHLHVPINWKLLGGLGGVLLGLVLVTLFIDVVGVSTLAVKVTLLLLIGVGLWKYSENNNQNFAFDNRN